MSRTIVLGVVVAAIGAGIYYYLNQPEPTPAERLQSAAQDAGDAVSDAVESVTEQASDATDQAGQAAADLANQAGEEVAALAEQGQDLLNSWIEEGTLTVQNFDYDAMVASVQDSALAQDMKTKAISILDEIKASPELFAAKLQELQALLQGQ
ncbi:MULTISPECIES: hypothetical protein [unclassified Ruegeria]|uniref:hypothetical protein n=1 Tax=unclassified Ruegeria TaxID=2625375 RepID=UPI001489138D|nr:MULTISPECIES: hypothetical protein [unclassified Ruegeria]